MKSQESIIEEMIKLDPLVVVEKITGESYKASKFTEALGACICMEHGKIKQKTLASLGDTTFSMDTDSYIKIVFTLGFEKVLEVDFKDVKRKGNPEKFFVFWHPEKSILLEFDTFLGYRNGGNFYYNWLANRGVNCNEFISSGGYSYIYSYRDPGYDQPVIIGDHDCREALVHNITRMSNHGTFLQHWIERPYLCLNHYADWELCDKNENGLKDYKYSNDVSKERLESLPSCVLDAITPEKHEDDWMGEISSHEKLNIKKVNGNFFSATWDGDLRIDATIFRDPSKFGINGGRISKLVITENWDYINPLYCYDRGEESANKIKSSILEEIIKLFKGD